MNELTNIEFILFVFLSIVCGLSFRFSLSYAKQLWSQTYHYTMTFSLLPPITMVITTLIAGNIALSLGMIGALSIVRFRHPVRSNFELTMYFALLTLGIAAGVTIKLAFLLLLIVLGTVLGVELVQKLMKYFKYGVYQLSFNEGIATNVLEVSTSKKNLSIQDSLNLVESFYSKSDNEYFYKLVFKTKDELNEFLQKISEDENTITYKTSSIVN